MNKELNIGDYCRDEKGNIDKLIYIREITEHIEVGGATTMTYTERYFEQDKIKAPIIKSSANIIDLIEVGDYVNGYKVISLWKDKTKIIGVAVDGSVIGFDENEIKSIVTKEMYSSVEYKIGE